MDYLLLVSHDNDFNIDEVMPNIMHYFSLVRYVGSNKYLGIFTKTFFVSTDNSLSPQEESSIERLLDGKGLLLESKLEHVDSFSE